ncbi:MAG: HlyD family efflux transporter periplasmic adaptor subunit [Lentisphaerota bacterium]
MAHLRIPEHARRHPMVWWSRFKLRWPLVCWLLAMVVAGYLYYHGGRFSGMSGTVEAMHDLAAPLETARLRAVHVIVGQEVRAGAVLAEMDTSILDAEMVMEKLQEERRFASEVAQIDGRLQEALIRQAEADGELEVLNSELERLDDLLSKRLIEAQTVTRLRARQQALKRAATLYPGLIRNLQVELESASNRMQTVAAWFGGGASNAPAGWKADEKIQRQFSLLELRRSSYILRAKADGVVARVDFKPGDIVNSGNTIVDLVVNGSAEVVGFLPESNARYIAIGMTTYLSRVTGQGAIIPARVTALTPEIMGLPNRANPYPGAAFRGRQVILKPSIENDFIPGESISIDLDKPALTLSLEAFIERLAARWRKGS